MKIETFERHFETGAEPKVGEVMAKYDGSDASTVLSVQRVCSSRVFLPPSWGCGSRYSFGAIFRVTVSK